MDGYLRTVEADIHGLLEVEEAVASGEVFGMPRQHIEYSAMRFYDSRFAIKGLTVNRPHGYGRTFAEAGIRSRAIMKMHKNTWNVSGQPWAGVPYVYGTSMVEVALAIGRYVGIEYSSKYGRGVQVRECCFALRMAFGINGGIKGRVVMSMRWKCLVGNSDFAMPEGGQFRTVTRG